MAKPRHETGKLAVMRPSQPDTAGEAVGSLYDSIDEVEALKARLGSASKRMRSIRLRASIEAPSAHRK